MGLHEDLLAATQVLAQLVGSAAACERRWRFGIGVGLTVALRVPLARASPQPRQESCRGPGKGLAVAPAIIPGKALAGGLVVLLGWDPAKGRHLL